MVKWGSNSSMINRFSLVRDLVDLSSVTRWLDVGCGTGAFQRLVYSDIEQPPEGLGIDISGRLVDYARDNLQCSNCRFRQKDFLELSEGDFDLITSIGVLQKTNIPVEQFFRHVSELLVPTGRAFIDTKHLDWEKFDKPDFSPEPNHRWFQINEITEPARSTGFVLVETAGFLPRKNSIVQPTESHTIFLFSKNDNLLSIVSHYLKKNALLHQLHGCRAS